MTDCRLCPVPGRGQPLIVLFDVLADFFLVVHHGGQAGEVVRRATAWNASQFLWGLISLRTALHTHKATIRVPRIPASPGESMGRALPENADEFVLEFALGLLPGRGVVSDPPLAERLPVSVSEVACA